MEVSSIVEYKFKPSDEDIALTKHGAIIPVIGERYMVREIYGGLDKRKYIRLEEIVNPIGKKTGKELGYWVRAFKQLVPPIEIEMLLEEVQELEYA